MALAQAVQGLPRGPPEAVLHVGQDAIGRTRRPVKALVSLVLGRSLVAVDEPNRDAVRQLWLTRPSERGRAAGGRVGNPAGQRGGLLHPGRHLRLVELRLGRGPVASSVLSSPLSSRARRSLPLRRRSTPSARRRPATRRLRRGSPCR